MWSALSARAPPIRRTGRACSQGMKLAHLSDLHLLEDACALRRGPAGLRLRFCSFLRPLDPEERRDRLKRALRSAVQAGAHHLLITGDLTEDGHDDQFEVLACELRRAPLPPEASRSSRATTTRTPTRAPSSRARRCPARTHGS